MRLTDRVPEHDPNRIFRDFVPPPRFAATRLEHYVPQHRTQAAALEAMRAWAAGSKGRFPWQSLPFFGSRPEPAGLYLDGGFGVGKTHLLVGGFQLAVGPKHYLSFDELTYTIGLLGMDETVRRFGEPSALFIDELELDDPGNTLMAATFLERTLAKGLRPAASSNTPPGALGEGRFHAHLFQDRLAVVAESFRSLRIDGEDYRHRDLTARPDLPGDDELEERYRKDARTASFDDFIDLVEHLGTLHPMRFPALLDEVEAVYVRGMCRFPDQAAALRWVHFVDKLYDRGVDFSASGSEPVELFEEEWRNGVFAKKYGRAISRLRELLG